MAYLFVYVELVSQQGACVFRCVASCCALFYFSPRNKFLEGKSIVLTVKAYLRNGSETMRWNGLICVEAKDRRFTDSYREQPEIEISISNTGTHICIKPTTKNYFHAENNVGMEDRSKAREISPILIDFNDFVCFGTKEEIINYGTLHEKDSYVGGPIFLCFWENERGKFIELIPHDMTQVSPKIKKLQEVLPQKYIRYIAPAQERILAFQAILRQKKEG